MNILNKECYYNKCWKKQVEAMKNSYDTISYHSEGLTKHNVASSQARLNVYDYLCLFKC